MATNVVEIKKSDAPREMSRADRRVIFAKLEEVYADEKTGYRAGWTDEKLAIDLGVPRQWVKTVRDENFGPIASNPEIEAVMAEAKVWRDAAVSLKERFEQFSKETQSLISRAEMIERKLFAVEKAIRP